MNFQIPLYSCAPPMGCRRHLGVTSASRDAVARTSLVHRDGSRLHRLAPPAKGDSCVLPRVWKEER
jgi:hypothetical protein